MKIIFLFPGVESKYSGLAKELFDASRVMQEYFDEADNCLDKNFQKLCFVFFESAKELENACLSLFVLTTSVAAFLKEKGIAPDLVAGFDVGEFAAAHTVGSLTLPDGLYLLQKYAQFCEDAQRENPARAIFITQTTEKQIQEIIAKNSHVEQQEILYIAAYETDHSFIISGHQKAMNRLEQYLREHVDTQYYMALRQNGMHTPMMDVALKSLCPYLEKIDFKDPVIPVWSNVAGQAVEHGEQLRAAVLQQIHAPVLWKNLIDVCSLFDIVIEIGTKTICSESLMKIYPTKQIISVTTLQDIEKIQEYMKKNETVVEEING